MGKIELTLTQYQKVFFVFHRAKKIKAGFHFCNRAMLIAAENTKIELDKFLEWAQKNQTLYFTEMLYAAYVVYCQDRYQSPEFDKSGLILSFGLLPDEKQKQVLKTWAYSEGFGVKSPKKKAVKT